MRTIVLCAVACLAACASNTGVVPMGGGLHMIAKQAATGFPGLGNLKAEAIQEAALYCSKQGKPFMVESTSETQPPYVLGNYPRAEVHFRCEAK